MLIFLNLVAKFGATYVATLWMLCMLSLSISDLKSLVCI